MYWLVEDEEQLKVLEKYGYKEAFIEIIPFNDQVHPSQNKVSLVYIRPILAIKGFMLCVDHSETLNGLNTRIDTFLKSFTTLYCRDKKETLHYFPSRALYDINTPPTTYIRPTTKTHDIFYRKHYQNKEINKIIPIVKHYELCEQIYWDLKDNINKEKTKYDEFFNNKTSLVFNGIERSGIRVHVPTFEGYFHPLESEYTYTQFNLKTTTTRPSNRFKNVNYAALNKDNGCRKAFIPRNDELVEIDITAYHPTIAGKLIDFKFEGDDIHSIFASMYGVDRDKAKELTFKQLYGGIFEQYKHLDFFKKIDEYIRNKWKEFNFNGFIECEISNYKFYKDGLDNMNPQKLFNYVLQNYETSQNILILWDILSILRGLESKLVLYTYDSFLIDLKKSDGILEKIQGIFKKYELNTKLKHGNDYNFGE